MELESGGKMGSKMGKFEKPDFKQKGRFTYDLLLFSIFRFERTNETSDVLFLVGGGESG